MHPRILESKEVINLLLFYTLMFCWFIELLLCFIELLIMIITRLSVKRIFLLVFAHPDVLISMWPNDHNITSKRCNTSINFKQNTNSLIGYVFHCDDIFE